MSARHAACFCYIRAVLLLAPLSACAAEPLQPGVARIRTEFIISPYAVHEECTEMVPGERLEYTFEARVPVAFNIHYHEGKTVVMPITREDTRADAGIYAPSRPQTYCLMWEAGRDGTVLDYRVRLLPGKPP